MNGEEFYQTFKDALNLFGLRWGDMKDMNVIGEVHFSFGTETFIVSLGLSSAVDAFESVPKK